MAYQLYSRGSVRSATPQISSPLPPTTRQPQPPIHPVPPQLPRSAATSPRATAAATTTAQSQESLAPYRGDFSTSHSTPHPHITVESVRTVHIPSLTRITSLLLPIRYPNSFYTNIITDPVVASLSRVAVYHDHPVAAVPKSSGSSGSEKVIGGIRCRLEQQDSNYQIQGRVATNLYIQTLHLLSPYRGHGVAASLLDSLLYAPSDDVGRKHKVSHIVKHYNIRSVTAHVHEANEDGLRWYVARGFKVQDGIVEGYYRRLQPSGAKIVRLDVQWDDQAEDHDQFCEAHVAQEESPNTTSSDAEDEGWEKVEADHDDDNHGVQPLDESRVLDRTDSTLSRKRKAEEESAHLPQRK